MNSFRNRLQQNKGFKTNPLNDTDMVQSINQFAEVKRRLLLIKRNHTKHQTEKAKNKEIATLCAILSSKRPMLNKFLSRIYSTRDEKDQIYGIQYKDMSAIHIVNAIQYYKKTYPTYYHSLDIYQDMLALRNYCNSITIF